MKSLKIGTALSVLYMVFAIVSFFQLSAEPVDGSGEAIGAAIGMVMILPHLITGGIGMIFNILGLKMNKKGFILTACILYTVTVAICIFWAFMLIPGMIFMWIGYSKFKKQS